MARTTDPVCQMCRREGMKLYLKGRRCESPKCPIEKEHPAPGMHGYRRSKLSEYGVRLREKQKLKRFYGVLERQFRRYFELASRSTENTGEQLLSIMERRLDNVVHRLGLAPSRAAARQLVTHRHVLINGRVCTIPSILLKVGDVVKINAGKTKVRERTLKLVKANQTDNPQMVPDFMEMIGNEPPEARVTRLPNRLDVDPRLNKDRTLNEQLIIEFCSR